MGTDVWRLHSHCCTFLCFHLSTYFSRSHKLIPHDMIPCAMPDQPRPRRLPSSSRRTNPQSSASLHTTTATAPSHPELIEIDISTLSTEDLQSLKKDDPFLYYSIPVVRRAAFSLEAWGARYVSFQFQRIHYHQATYKSVLQISWWMIFWETAKRRNVVNQLWSRGVLSSPSCLVCMLDSNKNKTRKRKEITM